MEELFAKIEEQNPTYSKSFKKIAGFIFSETNLFAVCSAKQVAHKIGVSETTVIRFCQRLGYEGYGDFQQEIQSRLFEKSSLSGYAHRTPNLNDSVKNLMAQDAENIQKIIDQIDESVLIEAVDRLTRAERTLVTGSGPSSSMATWFSFALDMIFGNVRSFFPESDNILIRINELNERSVFVAFSFHRYNQSTIKVARTVKERGAFIIGFTDHRFSPLAEVADLTLPIELSTRSSLDVAPVVFSIMNSIVSKISLQNPDLIKERSKLLDNLNAKDFFI